MAEPRDYQTSWEHQILASISSVYDGIEFVKHVIASVNVVTHQRSWEDDDKLRQSRVSAIGARNQHSIVTAEEVARKFNC